MDEKGTQGTPCIYGGFFTLAFNRSSPERAESSALAHLLALQNIETTVMRGGANLPSRLPATECLSEEDGCSQLANRKID
jgi:hypothetical protein